MKYEVTTKNKCRLYKIHVPVGTDKQVVLFQFIHVHHKDMTQGETDNVFLCAMDELDKIYTSYGRFAASDAVVNLFRSYGFEPFENADHV